MKDVRSDSDVLRILRNVSMTDASGAELPDSPLCDLGKSCYRCDSSDSSSSERSSSRACRTRSNNSAFLAKESSHFSTVSSPKSSSATTSSRSASVSASSNDSDWGQVCNVSELLSTDNLLHPRAVCAVPALQPSCNGVRCGDYHRPNAHEPTKRSAHGGASPGGVSGDRRAGADDTPVGRSRATGSFSRASSDARSGDNPAGVLFLPERIFQPASLHGRLMPPCLPAARMPRGTSVWVVDEDDVRTILKINWTSLHSCACNGRLCGTVVRHSGEMTLVSFRRRDEELSFCLSIPRVCLSLQTPLLCIRPTSPPVAVECAGGSGACGTSRPTRTCRDAPRAVHTLDACGVNGEDVSHSSSAIHDSTCSSVGYGSTADAAPATHRRWPHRGHPCDSWTASTAYAGESSARGPAIRPCTPGEDTLLSGVGAGGEQVYADSAIPCAWRAGVPGPEDARGNDVSSPASRACGPGLSHGNSSVPVASPSPSPSPASQEVVWRHYFEAAMFVPSMRCHGHGDHGSSDDALLTEVEQLFHHGKFEAALEAARALLARRACGALSTCTDTLVLQSTVQIFLSQYEDALRSAELCMRAQEPATPSYQAMRGVLCAARALAGCGKFSAAYNLLRTLDTKDARRDDGDGQVAHIGDLIRYMSALVRPDRVAANAQLAEQMPRSRIPRCSAASAATTTAIPSRQEMRSDCSATCSSLPVTHLSRSVRLTLNAFYHKLLRVHRAVRRDEVLCSEACGSCTIAAVSVLGPSVVPSGHCLLCICPLSSSSTAASPGETCTQSREPGSGCRSACDRAWRSASFGGATAAETHAHAQDGSANLLPGDQPDEIVQDICGKSRMYCSAECQQRAAIYCSLEPRHCDGLKRAKELILSKAAVVIDRYPLEMAHVTVMLFLRVVATCRWFNQPEKNVSHVSQTGVASGGGPVTPDTHLDASSMLSAGCGVGCGSAGERNVVYRDGARPACDNDAGKTDSARRQSGSTLVGSCVMRDCRRRRPDIRPFRVTDALVFLGAYPMVGDGVSTRLRGELDFLYNTVTRRFSKAEHELYTNELFVGLFRYVRVYLVCVPLHRCVVCACPCGVEGRGNSSSSSSSSSSHAQGTPCRRACAGASPERTVEAHAPAVNVFYVPVLVGSVPRAEVVTILGSGTTELRYDSLSRANKTSARCARGSTAGVPLMPPSFPTAPSSLLNSTLPSATATNTPVEQRCAMSANCAIRMRCVSANTSCGRHVGAHVDAARMPAPREARQRRRGSKTVGMFNEASVAGPVQEQSSCVRCLHLHKLELVATRDVGAGEPLCQPPFVLDI